MFRETWDSGVLGIIIGFVVGFLFLCCITIVNLSYKKGQIDAINGTIKYELIKQDNGSSEWEKKE